MTDHTEQLDQIKTHAARAEHARRANRDTLIAALAPYGVAAATIQFDGCGDEGQIDSVVLTNDDDQPVGMPTIAVSYVNDISDSGTPVTAVQTLLQALENFAYDVLGDFHGGWQDNDGGFGTVTLDVAARTATLDFNSRYTATENTITEL